MVHYTVLPNFYKRLLLQIHVKHFIRDSEVLTIAYFLKVSLNRFDSVNLYRSYSTKV